MGGDRGDRFKYGAGATINRGVFTVGTRIGREDPGLSDERYDYAINIGNGAKYKTFSPKSGYNMDKYRMRLFYFGFGGYRIGINSEKWVRVPIQNKWTYDNVWSPWFKETQTFKNCFYFRHNNDNHE